MSKKLKLVLIEWLDSCTSNSEWKSIKNVSGITKCTSVGFIIKKTKKYIILFPNICGTKNIQGCCDFTIPIGAIIKIKQIKLGA
jgi:hypothetical protein